MFSSEVPSECNTTGLPLLWADSNDCGNMPLAIVVALFFTALWGLILVFTCLRRSKHVMSATRDTTVAKKMQFLQGWCYSYFYTIVYLLAVFAVVALFTDMQYAPAAAIIVCLFFQTGFVSQIDVIGSVGRKPGTNDISFKLMLDYFSTGHLAKVVFKLSGHKEFESSSGSESSCSQVFCLGDIDNAISPKVYDIKDVVGIQGAFLGLPMVFVLLLTLVDTNHITNHFVSVEDVEADFTILTSFDFSPLLVLTAAAAFISALTPPLLGDWETYSKSFLLCILSVFVRAVEIVARVCFYVYFIVDTKYIALIMLGCEMLLMYFTNITANEVSAGGRTGSLSHYLYSSWESIFFMKFRRISVDKEFVVHGTIMPATIELIRFIIRTIATIIGYSIMVGLELPENFTEAVSSAKAMPALFFAGVAGNVLVVILGLFNFLFIDRKDVKRSDTKRLWLYWKQLPGCRRVCGPSTIHLNRDNNMGDNINYM